MKKRLPLLLLGIITVFVTTQIAWADIGVPMVAVFLPPAWLALFPIIIIEAMVGIRKFNLPSRECWKAAAIANISTTIIGIPVAWFVLALIEGILAGGSYGLDTLPKKIFAVTVQAPWLIPYESELGWMIPIASMFLALPMYLMSVSIESRITIRLIPTVERRIINTWMWQANAWSYLLIVLIITVVMPYGEIVQWVYQAFDPVVGPLIDGVFQVAKWILPRKL